MAVCSKTELHIPSVFGCEKMAMDFVASLAKRMRLAVDRIEDLKTAVAEACLNAMEHGNKMDASKKVSVALTVEDSKLCVDVHDEGRGIGQIEPPSIKDQIDGKYKPRGWGMFLMKNLMDEVEFETKPGGGNVVRMIVYLRKDD